MPATLAVPNPRHSLPLFLHHSLPLFLHHSLPSPPPPLPALSSRTTPCLSSSTTPCSLLVQAFNTFIDDVFAFIITMPTAHRVAVFRDDIVFLVYLYQRW